jgi:hypothetical protein
MQVMSKINAKSLSTVFCNYIIELTTESKFHYNRC